MRNRTEIRMLPDIIICNRNINDDNNQYEHNKENWRVVAIEAYILTAHNRRVYWNGPAYRGLLTPAYEGIS